MGRAQQMMMEQAQANPLLAGFADPDMIERTRDFWAQGMALWQGWLTPAESVAPSTDKRFKADGWSAKPDLRDDPPELRNASPAQMIDGVDALDGVTPEQREQLRFATRGFVDAMSPSNFALTNPEVIERTIETRGENLLKGLQHMLADLQRGQLTHTDRDAFALGRNLATTPGKVVKRTPLYELIQYEPTTPSVLATPLVIFPPWINRFYILDLTPEKSFIRWAVEQGRQRVSWCPWKIGRTHR